MPKINFHVILKFIGILLCMESIFMLVPFVVALIYGEGDAPAFIKSASITAIVGGILFYIFRNSRNDVGKRGNFYMAFLLGFRDAPILLNAQSFEYYRCYFRNSIRPNNDRSFHYRKRRRSSTWYSLLAQFHAFYRRNGYHLVNNRHTAHAQPSGWITFI